MSINTLEENEIKNESKHFRYFRELCEVIPVPKISEETVREINERIDLINEKSGQEDDFNKLSRKKAHEVIKLLEKNHKIVTKSYYQNLWMAIGMSAFGVPMGFAFSTALDNFAFFAIGLPIGMSMGLAIGASMDTKAKKEGRYMDISYL
jgi:hypothetical protein